MVKILVLLFGVAMFFGGFWRATEGKKQLANLMIEDDEPNEPESLPTEAENAAELEENSPEDSEDIEEVISKPAPVHKSAATARTKSKRTSKSKKAA